MSYLFPMNGTDVGLDRFEPTCYQGVQTDDDDDGEQGEREPFRGELKTGRGETRSSIDEMREFRRAKPEGCEHHFRDRDGRVDLEIGPDRGPRRSL
jgi:hypothetical protein